MKTVEILNVYNFLNSHDKYGNMGTGKVTLVLMLVKMGKIADNFETFKQDVLKKLIADKENFNENLEKARNYENSLKEGNKENLEITEEEYKTFILGDFKEVMSQLEEALLPELEKEVDITYKKFTADDYSEWITANNIDTKTAAYFVSYLLEE